MTVTFFSPIGRESAFFSVRNSGLFISPELISDIPFSGFYGIYFQHGLSTRPSILFSHRSSIPSLWAKIYVCEDDG